MSSSRMIKMVCDRCGYEERFDYNGDPLGVYRETGWTTHNVGSFDLCPACSEEWDDICRKFFQPLEDETTAERKEFTYEHQGEAIGKVVSSEVTDDGVSFIINTLFKED